MAAISSIAWCSEVASAQKMTRRLVPALLLLAALRASTWLAPAQLPTARRAAVASPRVPVAPQLGVPKFFRWLCERYPQITSQISAKRTEDDYVDNFYLDMNGIIHTCTHGDGVTPNQTTEQMVQKIFEYTERLIKIANPRKVVYLAIDGVAPRAKMNQQRSRRYRVPKEMLQQARRAARNEGAPEPESLADAALANPKKAEPFNSNCITPGTEFLQMLGERFVVWLDQKTSGEWAGGPTVIFSGANVVGEGEHKIMDYIRGEQRAGRLTGEERHCMYGLDADLIFLGMLTHEKHFTLLRERQRFQRGKFNKRGGRGRGIMSLVDRAVVTMLAGGAVPSRFLAAYDDDDARAPAPAMQIEGKSNDDFFFLELGLLRELLGASMRPRMDDSALGFSWDGSRAVDDFAFMCMLVGNDFLPGMPHLSVEDGALNLMLRTYTDLLPTLGGFLTDKATLHMGRFERFVRELARYERAFMRGKAENLAGKESKQAQDNPLAYRRQYYLQKLGLHPNDTDGKRGLVKAYLSGLCWCLAYYHEGCKSWDWYYPDFYAPLASDLGELPGYEISLVQGKPFQPLSQLLSVLPPQSASLLPAPYAELMLSTDSPIFDAFPADFSLDANGKKQDWEAIALLPFIDEQRLLDAVESIDADAALTPAERARNVLGEDIVFTSAGAAPAPPPAAAAAVPVDLEALKVSELKDELAALGEPTTGLKGELVERLEQAMRARE